MKKILMPVLALFMALAVSGKASASDVIDFREVSCEEYIHTMETAAHEDSAGMMLWLYGYSKGLSGTPVLDWGKLEQFLDRVVARCRAKGSARLIDVINKDSGR